MAEFETEEQQLEALRKWWQENGRGIVVGVVLGLGAVGGWRGWVYYTEARAESASAIYQTLMRNLTNNELTDIAAQAQELIEDYASTPYAELAALGDARAAVEQADYERAKKSLQWARDNANQQNIRHIARIRLARVLRQSGDLDAALEAIDVAFPAAFLAAAEELRGDLYLAKGDRDKARDAYRKALGASYSSVDRELVEMKFNDLRSDDAGS
ncbi:MAG: tetratricopeptide repeat protein [Gammaproteobacteria bacterium]|nr:tetratricopeptide repeat protein [Gammaproteobacteria bacterium]